MVERFSIQLLGVIIFKNSSNEAGNSQAAKQKVHILTSKKREGEICLILALSDLKTPLSQEKKGSSQPLILSSIFHNQSKQTVSGPFFVCLTTVTSQLKCS